MSGYTRQQMDAHLNAHRGLSEQQIAQGWVDEGGDPHYANLMAKLALRESGGRVRINNRGTNSNGTTDWGLFQVNDIWRKDPVIGPLFRSGAILTQAGATKAAIHILKVQGPQAWATYNPATDHQYLGGFKGGSTQPTKTYGVTAGTPPTFTPGGTSLDKRAVVTAALLDPRKGMSLSQRILGAATSGQYTTTTAPTVTPGKAPKYAIKAAAAAGGKAAKGVVDFEGHKVAAWIAPILTYARKNGWKGQVNSGYRSDAEQTRIYDSGVRPAAVPKSEGGSGSNHEGFVFPLGAVDVSEAAQLASILRKSPFAGKLQWAGAKDPVHFSHPHGGGY